MFREQDKLIVMGTLQQIFEALQGDKLNIKGTRRIFSAQWEKRCPDWGPHKYTEVCLEKFLQSVPLICRACHSIHFPLVSAKFSLVFRCTPPSGCKDGHTARDSCITVPGYRDIKFRDWTSNWPIKNGSSTFILTPISQSQEESFLQMQASLHSRWEPATQAKCKY